MCNELQVTLQGQQRTNTDKEELLNKWEELGNFQIGIKYLKNVSQNTVFQKKKKKFILDLSNYRPVYAPKDLLEVLLSLKGPQHQEDEYIFKIKNYYILMYTNNAFFILQPSSKMGILSYIYECKKSI